MEHVPAMHCGKYDSVDARTDRHELRIGNVLQRDPAVYFGLLYFWNPLRTRRGEPVEQLPDVCCDRHGRVDGVGNARIGV